MVTTVKKRMIDSRFIFGSLIRYGYLPIDAKVGGREDLIFIYRDSDGLNAAINEILSERRKNNVERNSDTGSYYSLQQA